MQFFQRASSMADSIFLNGGKLGKCLFKRRIEKYGVVTESLLAPFFLCDDPVDMLLDLRDDLATTG